MSKTRYNSPADKHFASIPSKNTNISETEEQVSDYLHCLRDDTNHILDISKQPFSLDIERCDADLGLSQEQEQFLAEYADPPAIPFVNGFLLALKLANEKYLHTCKYGLVIKTRRLAA
jgi:hypothetical protein